MVINVGMWGGDKTVRGDDRNLLQIDLREKKRKRVIKCSEIQIHIY